MRVPLLTHKPLHPQVITTAEARAITCHKLYEGFRERVHVDDVILTITPITSNGEPLHSLKRIIPDSLSRLREYCQTGFDTFEIAGDYKSPDASAYELMTRADFIFETLAIWSRMYNQISSTQKETLGADLLTADEVLRKTYMLEELGDISYLEEDEPFHCTNTNAQSGTQQNLYGE